MQILKLSLVYLFLTILFLSCKKNDPPVVPKCKVSKALFNAAQNSISYEYTNNLLTRLYYPGAYFSFEYDNNRPIKRKLFIGSAVQPNEYHDLIYNANGTLARIDLYKIIQTNIYYLYSKIIFSYNSEQLEKIEFYSVSSNVTTLEEDYTYTSHSGNIDMCRAIDYFPTIQVANFTYTYDNSLNYFKKQNPYGYILDPMFINTDGVFFPFFMSKNNVTNIQSNGANNPYSYLLNSNQDLYTFNIGNNGQYVVYEYNCN